MSQFSGSRSPHHKSADDREQTERAELLTAIEKGEKAIEEGRVLSQEKAKRMMSRWLRDESAREA